MIDSLLSLLLFFVAALFEIGGGYLVWLWLRENKSWTFGLMGAVVLFFYGIIPTFQPAHFGSLCCMEAYSSFPRLYGAFMWTGKDLISMRL
jgi:drug/metabolite transporter superfamily protein YnfA